jgi:hypothetical protein
LAYKHPFVALYLVIYSTLPAYMLTFQLFLESRGCEIMLESGEHMPTCPCSYARVGLHKMSTDIKWSSNLEIILFRQHFKNFYGGVWISNIFLEYLLFFMIITLIIISSFLFNHELYNSFKIGSTKNRHVKSNVDKRKE